MNNTIAKLLLAIGLQPGLQPPDFRRMNLNRLGRMPTPTRHNHKLRGVGITRKNRKVSKARRKMAAASRRINRPYARH